MRNTNIHLERELKAELKKKAELAGTSLEKMIIAILQEYINN